MCSNCISSLISSCIQVACCSAMIRNWHVSWLSIPHQVGNLYVIPFVVNVRGLMDAGWSRTLILLFDYIRMLDMEHCHPSVSSIGRSVALIRPCSDFSPLIVPTSFHISYYSSTIILVCSYLLLHSCCSHALGILCETHSSCMGSPFHTVNTRCSPCIPFFCNLFAATKDP